MGSLVKHASTTEYEILDNGDRRKTHTQWNLAKNGKYYKNVIVSIQAAADVIDGKTRKRTKPHKTHIMPAERKPHKTHKERSDKGLKRKARILDVQNILEQHIRAGNIIDLACFNLNQKKTACLESV